MKEKLLALKSRLPMVIGMGMLVLLTFLLAFLYLKTRRLDIETPLSSPTPEELITEIPYKEGNPIRKGILPDNEGIVYELEGSFPDGIRRYQTLLSGSFVLQGDPLKRHIRVLLGNLNGTINYGIYEGKFAANSRWRIVSQDIALSEIQPGEPVKIMVRGTSPLSGGGAEQFFELQKVMDTLAKEFDAGEFAETIPANFLMVATRAGVVR